MVHSFIYYHLNSPLYFLWDVESGSLHLVDTAAFFTFKKNNSECLSNEDLLTYQSFSIDEIQQANDELNELEKLGLLNSNKIVINFIKNISHVKALCLNICHDCNLSCEYCFAHDGTYNTNNDYMSLDVGKASIDFLIKNSGNIKNLEVDFFGGEPLLNLDVIKGIVSYAKDLAPKNNKNISFTLTTNCINLDEETSNYLNDEMQNVVLSIDGRENIHNCMRHSKNNKPTYKIITNNALYFKGIRGLGKYYIRGTFTANNLDFSNDVFALNDLGFDQISIEPVVLPSENPLSIKNFHLNMIFDHYDILAEEYIKRRKSSKWFNFFHYMIDLNSGPCIKKRLTGCGAGAEYLAVSPLGDLYPCHQFVGKASFALGNVFEGINNNKIRQEFAENTIDKKEHCTKCFAKYFCGGGCAANGYFSGGTISSQYSIGCELTRKRLENSLAIWAIEHNNIY